MTDIQSSVENSGPITRRLAVNVPADRYKEAVDKAYSRLQGRVKLPGFRPGKAPRKVLESHYAETVREDVTKDLIETSCAEALRTHNLDVVSAPVLVEQKFEENGDLHYVADLEVRPEVALKEYKGRELVKQVQRITEEDIDGSIARLRERLAQLVTEEERVNVAHGDIVLFDMTATSEGQPIASVSGEGYQLEVGSKRFPEDFERQMVGVTRGIPTAIDVNFPAEYPEAELAGKHVRFDVTVREIKNKVLPALDDDFVRELDLKGVDDMAQLRVKVREDLERHAEREGERRGRNRMLEAFVDEHEFAVPPSHVHNQIHTMMHEMGVEDAHAESSQELHKAVEPAAVKHVKARFILDAVAKAESLEVTEDELRNEVRRQIAAAGASADRVRQYFADRGAILQLHGNMLRDKAMQRIIEFSAQRDEQVDKGELAER